MCDVFYKIVRADVAGCGIRCVLILVAVAHAKSSWCMLLLSDNSSLGVRRVFYARRFDTNTGGRLITLDTPFASR